MPSAPPGFALLELLNDPVMVVSSDIVVSFANRAMERVLGHAEGSLVGMSPLEFVHPDDVGAIAESVVAGDADGRSVSVRGQRPDGSWVPLELVATNLFDDPDVQGVVVTGREARSREQEERQRRDVELRLDAAFDHAMVGMVLIGRAGRIMRVNPALCRMLRADPRDLVGLEAWQLTHPDDQADAEKLLRELVRDEHGEFEGDQRILRSDGGCVWARVAIATIRDDGGSPLYLSAQVVDLTERLAAVEALREQEERYRHIVEGTDQGVWMLDADGVTSFVNQRMAELFGASAESMVGRQVLDYLEPGNEEEGLAALARCREGVVVRGTVRFRNRDGRDVWTEYVANPLTDAAGAYNGLITLVTDVTEDQLLQQAVRRERERFRALVQESSDLIVVATADGTVDYVSPAVEAVLGRTPDELRGTPLAALLYDPTDAPEVTAGIVPTVTRMGDQVTRELRLRHRDGDARYCEVVARNMLDDPAVRGVVFNARDVTEARRNERRINALFEAANDIVAVLHPDGSWFASPAGTRLLGHPPGFEPEGGLLSLLHPDDVAGAVDALADLVAGNRRPEEPMEVRARHVDGEYRWLEAVARDLNDDPLVNGIVITARDITERRAAAAALDAAQARFREAFRASPVGIGLAHLDGTLTWVNDALAELTGIPVDELQGTKFQDLSSAEQFAADVADTQRLLSGEIAAFRREMRYDHPDGRTVWGLLHVSLVRDGDGKPAELLGQVEDITDRVQREQELHHDAEHDALTGLWNRVGLRKELEEAWTERDPVRPLALLFGDLDGFKSVNDQHGHGAGDELLTMVALRLRGALRAGDSIARWGGDEFVVLCPTTAGDDDARSVAERLRAAVAEPFRITAGAVHVGISIGVAVDADHPSPERLLEDADVAAYRAKLEGRVSQAP